MAIEVYEDGKSRSGDTNQKGENTYTRLFHVKLESPNTGVLTAKAAVGIVRGDVYSIGGEADLGSFCQTVQAQCISEDYLSYEVTVSYGPQNPSPLQQSPKMSLSFTTDDQQIEYDFQNRPVINSVGDPFAEMITRKVYSANLTYVRNQVNYDPLTALWYGGAVNSDYFLGAPPGFCRLVAIPFTEQEDEEFGDYFTVSYEFEFCGFGFKKRVLNQGKRQKINGKIKTILNDDGTEISEPVLLDSQGKKLAAGAPPVFLEFQNYVTAPFSVFGIF
jgi:hypothetical protein